MQQYTVVINPTGIYALGNPSRADDGQPEEEHKIEGTVDDAIDSIGSGRSGCVYDQWGDTVAEVVHPIGGARQVCWHR